MVFSSSMIFKFKDPSEFKLISSFGVAVPRFPEFGINISSGTGPVGSNPTPTPCRVLL